MKEILMKVLNKVMDNSNGKMEIFIKENFKMIKLMELEIMYGKIKNYIKVLLLIIKCMEKEF